MQEKVVKVIVWAVSVALLVATIFLFGYSRGEKSGMAKSSEEINQLERQTGEMEVELALLRSSQVKYQQAVEDAKHVHKELSDRNAILQRNLQNLSKVLRVPVKKTGDQCKDARAVARRYFEALSKEAKPASSVPQ